jgi:hypothetical protein
MRPLWLVMTLALHGCYTLYGARPGSLAPAVAAVPPDTRTQAWQRAVSVLVEDGYVPELLNETACYVSARRREDAEYDVLAGAMAIVTIAPDGQLRVQVSGRGLYQSQDQMSAAIARNQVHLLRRILNQPEPPQPPPLRESAGERGRAVPPGDA